jgi:hypothetical protein
MVHEDFFEAQLIEFTIWNNENEETIAKCNSFEELPSHLKNDLKNDVSKILFRGKQWVILEINRDLRAHGKGIHVKVRLG